MPANPRGIEAKYMKIKLVLLTSLCLLGAVISFTASAAREDGPKARTLAKYDKNGNGVIDGEEKDAIRRDYAANPNGELKRFDTDGDGKLSDEEMAAIKPGSGSKKKQAVKDTLAKYDKNGNGVIDGDEVEALRKDYAANPKGDLKVFDTNSDGKLDDKEIAAIKVTKGKKKKSGETTTAAEPAAKPEKSQ